MAPLEQHDIGVVSPSIKKKLSGDGGCADQHLPPIKVKPSIFPTYSNSNAIGSKREYSDFRV